MAWRSRPIEPQGINTRQPRDLAGVRDGVRVPVSPRFNWRAREIKVDVSRALRSRGNGMRVGALLDDSIAKEMVYQQWLLRTGSNGTRPEFAVFDALERMGLRCGFSDPPGADFRYQVGVNGGRQLGGAILDFLVESIAPAVAIRVQGEFFHFVDDPSRESDILQKRMIESLGYTVIDILAQDTLTRQRTDEVVRLALMGMELDTTGRVGVFR
jgi:hypothetical protein